MTVRTAQITLLWGGIVNILLVFGVLVSGRFWGFPLDYGLNEEIPLVQLITPPFFSLIGAAVYFLQNPRQNEIKAEHKMLLFTLIYATHLIFFVGFALLSWGFYLANRPGSSAIFSLDAYRLWITILLSLISLAIPGLGSLVFRKK